MGDALLHPARLVGREPVHVNGDEGEDSPRVALREVRPCAIPFRVIVMT